MTNITFTNFEKQALEIGSNGVQEHGRNEQMIPPRGLCTYIMWQFVLIVLIWHNNCSGLSHGWADQLLMSLQSIWSWVQYSLCQYLGTPLSLLFDTVFLAENICSYCSGCLYRFKKNSKFRKPILIVFNVWPCNWFHHPFHKLKIISGLRMR